MAKASPPYSSLYSIDNYLQRIETYLIREAIARHEGIIAHAAISLGLRPTTLWWRLRKMGIDVSEYRLRKQQEGGGGVIQANVMCEGTVNSHKKQTAQKQKTKRISEKERAALDRIKAT